jgi:hypothetical protein
MSFEMPNNPNLKKRNNNNITTTKDIRKFHNLCLTTVYFPHSGYKEKELEVFYSDISVFLSNILSQRNTTHIIGTDANSSIGTRRSISEAESVPDKYESHLDIDPATELLGPFGNPHRTKTGENLINIMREHQLRAAATFFDNNNKYNTWLAPPHPSTAKRQAYQLDHFLIPKYQLCQTTNVKRKFDGATSDHAALQIDFHLLNTPLLRKKETQKELLPPQSIDNKILRNQELSNFQKGVQNFFDNLQPDTATFQSPTELLNSFESHIVQTAV